MKALLFIMFIGFTCFMQAQNSSIFPEIQNNNLAKIKEIVATNPSAIFERVAYNWSTLHFAAVHKRFDIAKYLIEKGIDPNILDVYSQTPLFNVIGGGAKDSIKLELIKLFLSKGADINAKNIYKMTPLLYASINASQKIGSILVENGAKLLVDGVGINEPIYKGGTALHILALGGYLNEVKEIIQNGGNINFLDRYNRTPLYYAAESGHLPIVKLLIEKGAQLDILSLDGSTPLSAANKKKHTQIVAQLKESGAKQIVKMFPTMKGEYLGEKQPGIMPEVFAPGIISSDSWAEHSPLAVSPKGDEVFWSGFYGGKEQLFYSGKIGGFWSEPKIFDFSDNISTGGPVFTPDGKRLFIYSYNLSGGLGGMDVWYIEKTDSGWGKPINAGNILNSEKNDWSPTFTSNGYAYQIKIGVGLIRYKYEGGIFSEPESIIIHKDFSQGYGVSVPPDESYIIFSDRKEEGNGGLDLYISFKQADGKWGYPVNMGGKINSQMSERFPGISPDGKFLFFMRETYPDQDIYWVSTKIIDDIKKEVFNIKVTK